jgi:AcrR family transcriptional regulator
VKRRVAGDTRLAILAAAANEFAAHGFAGASVDAIAAGSGYNKAMIYYHFENKQGLYLEVLRDVFRALGGRTGEIAASAASPARKIEAFIDTLNEMASSRPYMPRIMMREMAEGAARLDPDTLRLMARIFSNLRLVLEEGRRAGAFRPADPLLTYFSLISPVIFFRVTAPVRDAFANLHILGTADVLDNAAFLSHLKSAAVRVLTPENKPAAPRRRRARPSRPGDHA